jgi:hypothetical protein
VENLHILSDAMADVEHWWEVSERDCQEHCEELTLLYTRGSVLCRAIVGPPWLRNHLSNGMWRSAPRHIEMDGELTMESSAAEAALECSPNETF